MENYKNSGGDSGIVSYEIGDDFIIVLFAKGEKPFYRYTNGSAGEGVINQMKVLARDGVGLNSFINTTVKKNYADNWGHSS